MARFKIVDGVRVPLTPEEEAAREAEEQDRANNGARRERQRLRMRLRNAIQDDPLWKAFAMVVHRRLRDLEQDPSNTSTTPWNLNQFVDAIIDEFPEI